MMMIFSTHFSFFSLCLSSKAVFLASTRKLVFEFAQCVQGVRFVQLGFRSLPYSHSEIMLVVFNSSKTAVAIREG